MKNLASANTTSNLSQFDEVQIQPNAIDLRLARVWEVSGGTFFISEKDKRHLRKEEVIPHNGLFTFNPRSFYEIQFEGTITIGPREAGFVITRSTLNRNGMFITSGLYDSGYSGAMAGALHNNSPYHAHIEVGTRVGQMLIWDAEALHSYNGSYGLDANGQVKTDEQRYFQ